MLKKISAICFSLFLISAPFISSASTVATENVSEQEKESNSEEIVKDELTTESIPGDERIQDEGTINPEVIQDDSEKETASTIVVNADPVIEPIEDINSWMPDKVLQTEVAKQLDLDDVNKITKEELKKLTYLGFITENGKDLASLKGLEYAINLEMLYIQESQVTDISPLASCVNLKQLYLMFSNITDISPLANLTQLFNLHVDANPFTDYSPIAKLTGLKEFGSRYSNIQDLSFLKEWRNLNLLYLWDNDISDLAPLQNLKNLTLLELSYNNISDISLLSDFSTLKKLYLGSNNLQDIGTLANLTALELLMLHDNHIADISALGGLTNLVDLNATNQTISLDKVLVAGTSYTQNSVIKNRDNHLLPLIPSSQDEVGTAVNNQIEWTNLNDSGTFNASWENHSSGPNNANYWFSGKITLPFERQQGALVLVKYIDENGKVLQPTIQLTGKIGDAYTTEKMAISNYKFKELEGDQDGVFTDSEQVISYIYQKESTEALPPVPLEPVKEEANNKPANIPITDRKVDQLPNTGEKQHQLINPFLALGLLLLGIGLIKKNKIENSK